MTNRVMPLSKLMFLYPYVVMNILFLKPMIHHPAKTISFSFHALHHAFTKYISLRIDNSRRSRIYSLWNISRTTKATSYKALSNERADYSACVDISGF